MWKKEYDKLAKSLFDYMVKLDYTNKPYPKIHINDNKQDEEIFITTGYYDNVDDEIVIFTHSRHVKDCLRTLAHEFVHWGQRRKGILNDDDGKTTSLSDKRLEMLESEAYEKGNIGFRKWTEYYQKKIGKE